MNTDESEGGRTMGEIFTVVDLEAGKREAREHEKDVRRERMGVAIIDLATLTDDLVRFMPEDMDAQRRQGYIEAVKDMLLHAPANTLEHRGETRSLEHSPDVSVPCERVDEALKRYGK